MLPVFVFNTNVAIINQCIFNGYLLLTMKLTYFFYLFALCNWGRLSTQRWLHVEMIHYYRKYIQTALR